MFRQRAFLLTQKVANDMMSGKVNASTPTPSFVFELIQRSPAVRELDTPKRMAILMQEWEKLSLEVRRNYLREPLKGVIEVPAK